jgi:hypothetical protein
MMLRLYVVVGATTNDPYSRGGDSPRIYLFPPIEVETVTEFTAWLQDHIRQEIQSPVAFTAEKIDEETGSPLAN